MFRHPPTFAFSIRSLAWTIAAGLTGAVFLGAPAVAQESNAIRAGKVVEPIVFTVDVAEDLAGKSVPTFVKPEHTQPERRSFFVTDLGFNPTGGVNLRVTFIQRPITN